MLKAYLCQISTMFLPVSKFTVLLAVLLCICNSNVFGQVNETHSDTCYHIEFSLAHHYLELAFLMEENRIEPNSLLAGKLTSQQLFAEFYRLVTLIQAKYPDHHLEEAFYDKAINVANKQQNIGAAAYLIAQKTTMLLDIFGADYLTKHCHCGKCTRHED